MVDGEDECRICFGMFALDELHAVGPCGHSSCQPCMLEWAAAEKQRGHKVLQCFTCRAQLSPVDLGEEVATAFAHAEAGNWGDGELDGGDELDESDEPDGGNEQENAVESILPRLVREVGFRSGLFLFLACSIWSFRCDIRMAADLYGDNFCMVTFVMLAGSSIWHLGGDLLPDVIWHAIADAVHRYSGAILASHAYACCLVLRLVLIVDALLASGLRAPHRSWTHCVHHIVSVTSVGSPLPVNFEWVVALGEGSSLLDWVVALGVGIWVTVRLATWMTTCRGEEHWDADLQLQQTKMRKFVVCAGIVWVAPWAALVAATLL